MIPFNLMYDVPVDGEKFFVFCFLLFFEPAYLFEA